MRRDGFAGSQRARESARRPHQDARDRDRKSTRLNSSHGYISYAVFCLKKKNHTSPPLPKRRPIALIRRVLTFPGRPTVSTVPSSVSSLYQQVTGADVYSSRSSLQLMSF